MTKPKVYLRKDCPYSFKLLLFLSEARLVENFEIIRCDPDSAAFEETKRKLAEASGKKATFPTVEVEPNVYKSDSDALVAHYAKAHNIDVNSLPAFSFYMAGIYPQLTKLHG